jgi:hypothetical protein
MWGRISAQPDDVKDEMRVEFTPALSRRKYIEAIAAAIVRIKCIFFDTDLKILQCRSVGPTSPLKTQT